MNFNVILFNDFESLDVFGPIEVIGKLEKFFQIECYSERGGIVRNLKATTNKMAFDWVREQDKEVQWIRKARWVNDGKYYTSSGVSAGAVSKMSIDEEAILKQEEK